jgi:hypothetical protein
LDGKYRRITITVNRKDVTVAYRRGYAAQPELPPTDWRETLTQKRLQEATAAGSEVSDIGLEAAVERVGTPPGQHVSVRLQIDPSSLRWSDADGRKETTAHVLILCGDKDGRLVGKTDHRISLSLDVERYRETLKGRIPYITTIGVDGQPAHVKIILYSAENDRLTIKTLRLR